MVSDVDVMKMENKELSDKVSLVPLWLFFEPAVYFRHVDSKYFIVCQINEITVMLYQKIEENALLTRKLEQV